METYVVYEKIAIDFDRTRYKMWQSVKKFMDIITRLCTKFIPVRDILSKKWSDKKQGRHINESLRKQFLMTKKPVTITRDTMAAEALNLMEEKEITSLLVVDEKNSLLGILTLNELIKSGIS